MSYPKYSIVIDVAADGTATVTSYTDKAAAKAAFATARSTSGHSAYLYLEAMPSESFAPSKVTGTFTDAYGVVRDLPGLGVHS
jgi:hypothetical protein